MHADGSTDGAAVGLDAGEPGLDGIDIALEGVTPGLGAGLVGAGEGRQAEIADQRQQVVVAASDDLDLLLVAGCDAGHIGGAPQIDPGTLTDAGLAVLIDQEDVGGTGDGQLAPLGGGHGPAVEAAADPQIAGSEGVERLDEFLDTGLQRRAQGSPAAVVAEVFTGEIHTADVGPLELIDQAGLAPALVVIGHQHLVAVGQVCRTFRACMVVGAIEFTQGLARHIQVTPPQAIHIDAVEALGGDADGIAGVQVHQALDHRIGMVVLQRKDEAAGDTDIGYLAVFLLILGAVGALDLGLRRGVSQLADQGVAQHLVGEALFLFLLVGVDAGSGALGADRRAVGAGSADTDRAGHLDVAALGGDGAQSRHAGAKAGLGTIDVHRDRQGGGHVQGVLLLALGFLEVLADGGRPAVGDAFLDLVTDDAAERLLKVADHRCRRQVLGAGRGPVDKAIGATTRGGTGAGAGTAVVFALGGLGAQCQIAAHTDVTGQLRLGVAGLDVDRQGDADLALVRGGTGGGLVFLHAGRRDHQIIACTQIGVFPHHHPGIADQHADRHRAGHALEAIRFSRDALGGADTAAQVDVIGGAQGTVDVHT